MIDTSVLVTGGVGMLTTIVSGWTSWVFAKRKYDSEVDASLIGNMQQSLEFYQKLSDDNRERLEEMIKRNEALEQEVNDLKRQVLTLMNSICMDLSCQLRKREEISISRKEKGDEAETVVKKNQ